MKKKRAAVEQIVAILKQVELGMPVADATQRLGNSDQTSYRWTKLNAGLQPEHARELQQLQEQHVRLKRLVADLSFDKIVLQHLNAKQWPGPRWIVRQWTT